jgi:hypothetical protein
MSFKVRVDVGPIVRSRGIEPVWRDLRHALRALRRTPAFTITAVLTLAPR